MAINKVIYGNRTLIDLTGDSVEDSSLLSGSTAHNKAGEQITGKCTFDVDSTDATATASEILLSKTAYARGSMLVGKMPNNGSVTSIIESINDIYTIPNGYHDGSGTVSIDPDEISKLIPENIREGIEVLGVEGTMSGSEGMNAQSKTVTPTSLQQIILPDTNEGYNCLASVTVEAIPYTETENAAGGITVTIG